MGGVFSGNRQDGYRPDRSILVNSEVNHAFPSNDDFSLDITSSSFGLQGLRYGADPVRVDSPSDCTTISCVSSATPLDQKHRYHLFFAFNSKDKTWVEGAVARLEDEPYNYRCCLADRDFDSKISHMQNVLCSVMLSQRVIVVLTPHFVSESWGEYEDALAHLTSLSQRRQRIVPIVLEHCPEIPECLRSTQAIDARDGTFWETLFTSIFPDGLSLSSSTYTIRSLTSQPSGYTNGQRLVTLSAKIRGFWHSFLLFNHEEVPESLTAHDVHFCRGDYSNIVRMVGREEKGIQLPCFFSAVPTLFLVLLFLLWCLSFILVITLFPDNLRSTLPVRLCVFSIPAFFIVFGSIYRWRKLKQYKETFAMGMFSRSIQANKSLHERNIPVLMSTARTHEHHFHIYFLYFNKAECIEHLQLVLTHCSDDDLQKLNRLVDVYTLNCGYLSDRPVSVRLAVMLCSSYAINFIFKRIPHSLEQRHSKRRQCLCQFTEEFLNAYLPCTRQQAVDATSIKHLFIRYLNCHLEPDPVVMQSLGFPIQC